MTDTNHGIDPVLSRSHRGVGTTTGLLLLAAAFAAGGVFRDPILRLVVSSQPSTGPTNSATSASKVDVSQQLWTCSMHPQVIQDHPGNCPICHMALTPMTAGAHAASHSSTSPAGTVMIDPIIVQRMGVRVATVATEKLTRVVRVVGTLIEPDPLHHDVNLRVSGWVDKLYADVDGMPVEAGKPLFDLYSPELNLGIEELIAARKQRDMSIGDSSAAGMYAAASAKLQRFGLTDAQIEELAKSDAAPRAVPILSPMTGHVAGKTVYVGSAVKAGDLMMKIVDRSQMWAELQVYEPDLPYVQVGQTAKVTVAAQPGKTFAGQVSFIHPHMDMMTRSARVRLVLPNADHLLREGMYVTAELESMLADNTVVVPREAVIDTGTRQLAFLWNANGAFEPRVVQLGLSDGNGSTQVLDGLAVGEKVVTSGQFLIDSESRTQEAVQKALRERLALDAPAKADAAPVASMTDMPPASGPASDFQQHAEAMVDAYLALANRLGAKQEKDEPLNVDTLVKEADSSSTSAPDDEIRKLAASVHDMAKKLSGVKLSEQREQFGALSAAVIALVDKAPALPKGTDKLFVLHCPMADADWLQDKESVANPFYPTSMKDCGSVTRSITASKK